MNIEIDIVPLLLRELCENHIGSNKTAFCKSYALCSSNGGCPLEEGGVNVIKTKEELKEFIKEQNINIKFL